ncbi:hypothetical protein OS493_032447 [Desmophyllum pertusum]|uniref:Uncharacterized protein n=1 Tax=Desmophyllum pertusum TaxID=174260 RepID=A0A9X0A0A3_9CNID|nr:hypothetical protein OS493_032447 [Desmophyllum pertusum]
MNKHERLLLTLCVVGCVAVFLPTAFAGSFCYRCSTQKLESWSDCAKKSDSPMCPYGRNDSCFAATAELTNGTMIGYKGCFPEDATCNNGTACIRAQNITGVLSEFQKLFS